jgi:hypothetical protein
MPPLQDQVDAAADATRPPTVAARRVTRTAAVLLMAGLLVLAALAGCLLAGRGAIGDLHQPIGHAMVAIGFVPLLAGLIGRRRAREPGRLLGLRAALAAVVLTVMLVGDAAAGGTRDLLMLHIPLAIVVMGLSGQLLAATGHDVRPTSSERGSTR